MDLTEYRKSHSQMETLLSKSLKLPHEGEYSSSYFESYTIFKIIIIAALENDSIEDAIEMMKYTHIEFNSNSTKLDSFLDRIQQLNPDEMGKMISNHLQSVALQFPTFESNKVKCVLSLDLHIEEYYYEEKYKHDERLILATKIKGIKRETLQYGRVSIVSATKLDFPLTIGFAINVENQSRKDIVCHLMDQIEKFPIEIEYILLDGGLASKESLEYLNNKRIRWIVQGKKFKKDYIADSGSHFSTDLKNLSGIESHTHVFDHDKNLP